MLATRHYDPVRRLKRSLARTTEAADNAFSRGDFDLHAALRADAERVLAEIRRVRGWLA